MHYHVANSLKQLTLTYMKSRRATCGINIMKVLIIHRTETTPLPPRNMSIAAEHVCR